MQLAPEHFHSFDPKGSPILISSHSLSLSLQPLATPNLLPLVMDLPILTISYKWDRTIYKLWCRYLSLSIMSSRSIHVVARTAAPFLFITSQQYPSVGIDHILCMHSSVDGHLGCVYLLTLVICAPRVFVQVFECLFLVLVGTYSGVELLCPLASLCLTEELPDCFPEHLIYFSLCTHCPQQLC